MTYLHLLNDQRVIGADRGKYFHSFLASFPLKLIAFSIRSSSCLIVDFPSSSLLPPFITTQIKSVGHMVSFSPTSTEGGVALRSIERLHNPESKSDDRSDSSSRSDRNRSQFENPSIIIEGDAAPNYHPNEMDAQDLEMPPVYPAATVDEPPRPLRWWDVSSLIINKMIGTGIYTAPPTVLILTGNKREALGLWITGFVYTLVR